MKLRSAVLLVSLAFLPITGRVWAQEAHPSDEPVKLADLLAEAEHNNPEIQAACRTKKNLWKRVKKT